MSYNYEEDGVTHINVYSKGRTALGRFLSNFAHTPVETEDGTFQSIEGYWYWLGTRNEELRDLYGYNAKEVGKKSTTTVTLSEEEFKRKIKVAIHRKITKNKVMLTQLKNCVLPLTHYYVFGDVCKPAGHLWVVEYIDSLRETIGGFYTATYRYPGPDRLDITVKGQDPVGKYFAPTWEMVQNYKSGRLSEEEYTKLYYESLIDNWVHLKGFKERVLGLIERSKKESITLVCFCPAGTFCHRHLLINWLKHNWAIVYRGER